MRDPDETLVLRRYLQNDRHYDELSVNGALRPLWDDVAALRRYLVEAGLLDRTPDGVYWRSGGPVDV